MVVSTLRVVHRIKNFCSIKILLQRNCEANETQKKSFINDNDSKNEKCLTRTDKKYGNMETWKYRLQLDRWKLHLDLKSYTVISAIVIGVFPLQSQRVRCREGEHGRLHNETAWLLRIQASSV